MIGALRFVLLAYRGYRLAQKSGRTSFVSISRHGVPQMCVFVGLGRDAWRISLRAIEEFEAPKEHP